MKYTNSDMKLDQFVAYLNEGKINLVPPFQRGHAWRLPLRRKLIENVVKGRPIPAIFLYRDAVGNKYEYNILDGKQRLESLILFIGDKNPALAIRDPDLYFAEKQYKKSQNFKIDLGGKKKVGFQDLDDDLLRDLQVYRLSTIEITLDQDNLSALDEIINLFVDINSYGEPVKRFQIVKAMSKDRLLRSVRSLIARREERGKDVLFYRRRNEFTEVLETLQVVGNIKDSNSKVDRMWELLVEIVLFYRTKEHRNPVEILKSFIRTARKMSEKRISEDEDDALRKIFSFIRRAYLASKELRESKLAVNQIHFYTMITAIIAKDLLSEFPEAELIRKLSALGQIVDDKANAPVELKTTIKKYQELSSKQTTHVNRRQARQGEFLKVIRAL